MNLLYVPGTRLGLNNETEVLVVENNWTYKPNYRERQRLNRS